MIVAIIIEINVYLKAFLIEHHFTFFNSEKVFFIDALIPFCDFLSLLLFLPAVLLFLFNKFKKFHPYSKKDWTFFLVFVDFKRAAISKVTLTTIINEVPLTVSPEFFAISQNSGNKTGVNEMASKAIIPAKVTRFKTEFI